MSPHTPRTLSLVTLTLAVLGASNARCEAFVDDRPDIVLIVADDMGYGDLTCYGSTRNKTPNIDRLSRQGVKFTQFYSNGPECSPTRTALLTGRYQQRAGGLECALGVGNAGRYDDAIRLASQGQLGLPPKMNALTSVAKKQGYRAYAIGKWHLGYEKHLRPLKHGFDYAIGPLGGGVDYFHHTEPAGLFLGTELPGEHMMVRNDEPYEAEGYMTSIITAEAVSKIRDDAGKRPYLLYVPYTAPHTPLQGPGDYRDTKMTGPEWNVGTPEKYAELIAELDKGVGEILAAIEKAGTADNTLVIFFSDNGPTKTGSAGNLSGLKSTLYEGGIRVPCIIRWPGKIEPGTVSKQMAISMDLTASITRATGGSPPKKRPYDGIDIVQHVQENRPLESRTLFWRARRGERTRWAVRDGWWKYHREQDGDKLNEELVRLDVDSSEKSNLIEKERAQLKRLKDLLVAWETEVKAER
jgi:arylsulfatase A-like enzyme